MVNKVTFLGARGSDRPNRPPPGSDPERRELVQFGTTNR